MGDLRVFAHGGGVQSTAALVLSAQGRIDFPVHLFCNVGDDSEHPATLRYVREVSMPYAKAHGVELVEIRRPGPTLRQAISQQHDRTIVSIPMRGANGAPGRRECTGRWKMRVLDAELRERGAKLRKAVLGIGISVDEIERAGKKDGGAYVTRVYPLIDLGLRRSDCLALIAEAGLPEPPKSSCYFCPFHRPSVWAEMRRDEPELFEQAAQLESEINTEREKRQREPVWLTRFARPLREAIGEAQPTLFGDGSPDIETCDEGVCFV